jgi:hypothetical protein
MEVDPWLEVEAEWWKGRTREAHEGWFLGNPVEIMGRKALLYQQQQPETKEVK